MYDISSKINKSIIILMLPIVILLSLLIGNSDRLSILSNSPEINEIFYLKSMLVTFLLLIISAILFTAGSLVILYAAYKNIQLNLNIYRSFTFFLAVHDVFIVCMFYYFNLKSDSKLSQFLTLRVNEINSNPTNLQAFQSMNNIQNYFTCCGFNNSEDYFNITEGNSCHDLDTVIPTMSASFKNYKSIINVIKPIHSVKSGCYVILSHFLNEDLWVLIFETVILIIFKIFGMIETGKIYESRQGDDNNELQESFNYQTLLPMEPQQPSSFQSNYNSFTEKNILDK